ncbi:MAG TPA: PAS domain S-box protein [Armatimonadetes bacterium]|nr:PAS domain S-box protein [Armatimonadota bacterium]
MRRFIAEVANSPRKVKLLLFLHQNPDLLDTAAGLASWLSERTSQLQSELDELVAVGVLERHGEGEEAVYAYVPEAKWREQIARFAAFYAQAAEVVRNELEELAAQRRQMEEEIEALEETNRALRQQNFELLLLSQIGNALSALTPLEEKLGEVIDILRRELALPLGAIFLSEEEIDLAAPEVLRRAAPALVLAAVPGQGGEQLAREGVLHFPPDLLPTLAQAEGPLVVTHLSEQALFSPRQGWQVSEFVLLPLITRNHLIGVLVLSGPQVASVLSEAVERGLQTAADQMATVIHQERLFAHILQLKTYNDNILRSLTSAVVTLRADGTIALLNPAAEALFHLSAAEAEGLSYQDVFGGHFNARLVNALQHTLETHQPFVGTEVEVLTLSGERRILNLRLSPLQDEQNTAAGLVMVADDVTAELQRRAALYRYVPGHVADSILAHPEQVSLAGERRQVTVLLADVRGFMALSSQVAAEEVVAILNDFFALATEVIFHFEGTLDKFIGDAVLALFGAPQSHEDDALRAVQAAVTMQVRMSEVNARLQASGRPLLSLGIGIATGEAVAGYIGSERRLEYTAIGDAVNRAARLEEIAGRGQTLLDAPTYRRVAAHITVRPLRPVRLKGMAEPVAVYEVTGLREEPPGKNQR